MSVEIRISFGTWQFYLLKIEITKLLLSFLLYEYDSTCFIVIVQF